MRIEIELHPGEGAMAARLASMAGVDVDTFLQQAVRQQLDSALTQMAPEDVVLTKADWKSGLQQWSDRHPQRRQSLNVSRDLMY